MVSRAHPAFFVIFVVLVAPVGAAVLVAVLLLFGVPPRLVFAPGWAVKSFLQSCGVSAPNAVGVATTVGLWWFIFVAAGMAWDRRRKQGAG
jgi:hypothetical protein